MGSSGAAEIRQGRSALSWRTNANRFVSRGFTSAFLHPVQPSLQLRQLIELSAQHGVDRRARLREGVLHPGTKIHHAAGPHDRAMGDKRWFESEPHLEYARNAFHGQGREMGPWGQAYRLYASGGLGLWGTALKVAGR
jgi:hypothetical protein